MAGKRINLSDLADEPPLQEARIPAFADTAPRSARVEQIAPNPLNTRDIHAHPAKIASIAESMRLHGQLQPCTVVTRSAFLVLFPEHESSIGAAAFVQVTGGRRRAAAIQDNRPTLDITVKNDVAGSRAQFISATAAENIDREDYDPVEEARAVQLLVQECGTGKAAAEQLGRTPPWVTQRLNLLKLAPGVQAALRAGEIPLREVRDLHTSSAEEQLAALAAWRDRQAGSGLTAVNPDPAGTPEQTGISTKTRAPRPSPTAAAVRKLGDTPAKIAAALRSELPPEDLRALAEELLRSA
jgi:ParB family chromosome partitioning protein